MPICTLAELLVAVIFPEDLSSAAPEKSIHQKWDTKSTVLVQCKKAFLSAAKASAQQSELAKKGLPKLVFFMQNPLNTPFPCQTF